MKQNDKGFTLMELLIVIAIISVLVAIAIPMFSSQLEKSREVTEGAAGCGAQRIVTACPLCKYNLVKSGSQVPVVYFTELLAEALGVKEEEEHAE